MQSKHGVRSVAASVHFVHSIFENQSSRHLGFHYNGQVNLNNTAFSTLEDENPHLNLNSRVTYLQPVVKSDGGEVLHLVESKVELFQPN